MLNLVTFGAEYAFKINLVMDVQYVLHQKVRNQLQPKHWFPSKK